MAYTEVVKDGKTYYKSEQGLYSREPPVAAPGERPVLPVIEPYALPEKPTFESLAYPTYTIPERKPERVEELTQQLAAPGVKGLRTQVQRAIGKRYINPQVARMTLREALAGYGQGLESVMGGARRGALTQYEQEYAPQAEKARMEYQAGVGRAQSEWEAKRQAQIAGYQTAAQAQALKYQTGAQTRMAEYESAWKDYMESQPYRAIQGKRATEIYGGTRQY